jgi:tRNA 5-methylaminomethyl-2-thiouridine biosynthesis bifunctional protein
MPRLPPTPRLDWTTEGVPRAAAFDDIYFSRAGGLAESEAVFLHGCGLPDAWRGKHRFAICELGFGTGLNVLAAWRAWKTTRSPHAVLHISTIEAFPLAREDAARALERFPEVQTLTDALLAHWHVRVYAPQRLWFPEDGFALTLFIGEAETILAQMRGGFDAWVLDGFAPARNAAMWSPEMFRHMARLSNPGARAATFTVASEVRRGLEAAGFTVEKKPGFGAKRERLEARLTVPPAPAASLYPYGGSKAKRVAVIGAGIAGAACAHALQRRGVETIVLDAARALGAGASGNPAGLVMPRLDRGGGAVSELFLAAYLDAIATYEALGVFDACGVEQRANEDDEALADVLKDPPLPQEWFTALADGAALHPRAGVVRPGAAIEAMLAGAQIFYESAVAVLASSGDGWVLRADDGRALLKADAVVLACGAGLTQFAPAQFLPLTLSYGQIEWGRGAAPSRAIASGNYVAPFDGGVLFGATFDKQSADPAGARARNLAALTKLAPEIAASLDADSLQSRASERVTTPDRLPIAGLLPDADVWLTKYAALAHGGSIDTGAPPPAHRGVYVIGGLGARGLTLAPLLGERIASEICGEPAPLSQRALDAIHPARFLHRSLKRR